MQKHHRGIIPTHPNVQEPILNLLGEVGVRQRSPPLQNDGVDSQVTAKLYPDLDILYFIYMLQVQSSTNRA